MISANGTAGEVAARQPVGRHNGQRHDRAEQRDRLDPEQERRADREPELQGRERDPDRGRRVEHDRRQHDRWHEPGHRDLQVPEQQRGAQRGRIERADRRPRFRRRKPRHRGRGSWVHRARRSRQRQRDRRLGREPQLRVRLAARRRRDGRRLERGLLQHPARDEGRLGRPGQRQRQHVPRQRDHRGGRRERHRGRRRHRELHLRELDLREQRAGDRPERQCEQPAAFADRDERDAGRRSADRVLGLGLGELSHRRVPEHAVLDRWRVACRGVGRNVHRSGQLAAPHADAAGDYARPVHHHHRDRRQQQHFPALLVHAGRSGHERGRLALRQRAAQSGARRPESNVRRVPGQPDDTRSGGLGDLGLQQRRHEHLARPGRAQVGRRRRSAT